MLYKSLIFKDRVYFGPLLSFRPPPPKLNYRINPTSKLILLLSGIEIFNNLFDHLAAYTLADIDCKYIHIIHLRKV